MSDTKPNAARAIVSRGPLSKGLWKMEDVTIREPGDDEVVVRVVASGVCSTDVHFGNVKEGEWGACYPCVKGHEGSGIVERTGSSVTTCTPGDPVLLSFSSCTTCALCTSGHPVYCPEFNEINFLGRPVFSPASTSNSPEVTPTIRGSFFGQSSFASRTVVREMSVVNVKGLVSEDEGVRLEELRLLAPLGCGIQTGWGTIKKVAGAGEEDVVCVVGLGGVGLSGIMAAKALGCKVIIGIDVLPSRLSLATDLGATHTLLSPSASSPLPLATLISSVRALTPSSLGPTITLDTTGIPALIRTAIAFTAPRGKILQVGTAPPSTVLDLPIFEFMVQGKQYIGAIEGDSVARESVAELVGEWRAGRLGLENIVEYFGAEGWENAVEGMRGGGVVKPVLVW
ncbi:putative alcohol dehydrogenase [Mytilinidion resinicola]|uniref:Alcohol dehydrogenase n=1 Tax=Mytilinidion resinicola TaxID=574789 RepID=A0A6A6YFB4_9PEZI|nr:putative alcohol dehydrogenase [Mytilinidion resinicola]KAF2806557.1 putative alcohol dehydrogenase [Mytilinidion resinicola]